MNYTEFDASVDAHGVHWFWWVFWAVLAMPVVLIVALVHNDKKNRAIEFYRNNYRGRVPYEELV